MAEPGEAHDSLARRLGLGDAVLIGVGAMLGAGIFAVPGAAAAAAGSWLLVSLLIAAVVAYANATSSAQLAAVHPQAGGTVVYARARLGDVWGFLAGWCFVAGKTASLAAMALTFGSYVYAPAARPLGIAAVLVLTAVNYRGVEKTVRLTRVIVAIVLMVLTVVVVVALSGSGTSAQWDSAMPQGGFGILQAAGLLFFAFAGYARLATLGEEVNEPAVTIPRAIPRALGFVLAVYALVLGSALYAVGPQALAAAVAPLGTVVSGQGTGVELLVRIGAAVAAAGVLLSLLAGVSRTVLAMARRGELPSYLNAVHPRHRSPHRAELGIGLVVVAVAALSDLRGAIGFSAFAILVYYALTNASALRLRAVERRAPRPVAIVGLLGCLLLAATLPRAAVIGGVLLLALGLLAWPVARRSARKHAAG